MSRSSPTFLKMVLEKNQKNRSKLCTMQRRNGGSGAIQSKNKASPGAHVKLRKAIKNPPPTMILGSNYNFDISGFVCVYPSKLLSIDDVATPKIMKLMEENKRDFFFLLQPLSLICFVRTKDETSTRQTSQLNFASEMKSLLKESAQANLKNICSRKSNENKFVVFSVALSEGIHADLISFCNHLRGENSSAFAEILVYRTFKIEIPSLCESDYSCPLSGSSLIKQSNLSPKRISNPFPAALATVYSQ